MAGATLEGIYAVKLPVSDLARSRAWYERVLGFVPELEFPDADGVVRGVAGRLAGVADSMLALREDAAAARGVSGFNLLNLAIADRASAEAWAARLDDLGVDRSPVIEATIGWIVVLHDPDGIELHLYSREGHGEDRADRAGFGRPVATSDAAD